MFQRLSKLNSERKKLRRVRLALHDAALDVNFRKQVDIVLRRKELEAKLAIATRSQDPVGKAYAQGALDQIEWLMTYKLTRETGETLRG